MNKMIKYVSLFPPSAFYLKLKLGLKDSFSVSTLTLDRLKGKKGGGAVVRLLRVGLVGSQNR